MQEIKFKAERQEEEQKQTGSLPPSIGKPWGYLLSSRCLGLVGLNSLFAGSKSDGQRSPNDTVFLRMDEIPYIHEDRPETFGEDGEHC